LNLINPAHSFRHSCAVRMIAEGKPVSDNELPRSRAAKYHRYSKPSNNFSCLRYICL
jgi:hypothetical protein